MFDSPILFLDIDGVLNSSRYWHDSGQFLPMGRAGAIDPQAVARLNTVLDAVPETIVVLCSSWRSAGVAYCREVLAERGFAYRIHGATRGFVEEVGTRWDDIAHWLDTHPLFTGPVVVLDDDGDARPMGRLANNRTSWVQPNHQAGLTDEAVPMVVHGLTKGATP